MDTDPNDLAASVLLNAIARDPNIDGAFRRILAGEPAMPSMVSVPISLAERTEAMFRSVDPNGGLAWEWKRVLSAHKPEAAA